MSLIPIKKTRGLSLIREVEGSQLARFADDVLLSKAQIISEGSQEEGQVGQVYSGSTLLSIDLTDPELSRLDSQESKQTLLNALRRSISFRLRLMRLARVEVERRCEPLCPSVLRTELAFTIDTNTLLIDIEVESSLKQTDDSETSVEEGVQ